ncbi:MAG: IS3 family transposase [Bacteroidia bacterium]
MDQFRRQGHAVGLLLRLLWLPRSTYYHKGGKGLPGRRASASTAVKDGTRVADTVVVRRITTLLGGEFVDYGYRKVTHWLRWRCQFAINHKKVLRLMRAHNLMLPPRPPGGPAARQRVVEKVPQPSRPREVVELDIMSIRVQGSSRNALLLNFIDLFHREWLPFRLGWGIRKEDVIAMVREVFGKDHKGTLRLRSDNGGQFIAKELADALDGLGIEHEFIRPACPEQNAHVESFHSALQRAVVRRQEFETIGELRETLERFRQFYNHERLHSATCYRPPMEFLRLYEEGHVREQFDGRNRRKFILSKEGPLSPPFSEHNNVSLNSVIHNQLSLQTNE